MMQSATVEKGYQKDAWILIAIVGVFYVFSGVVFLAGVDLDPPLFNNLIGQSLSSFNSANPDKATAMTYLFHGIGLFGFGLGLFTIAISFKPYKRNEKWAWYTVLYLPIILLISTVANYIDGGQSWPGGMIFFIVSLAGLLLPYRKFFPKR
jgi:hypothetical protein